MNLKYEPSSEPLYISVKQLFGLRWVTWRVASCWALRLARSAAFLAAILLLYYSQA